MCIRRVQREMREVRQKELEQEKRVKGAQFARLQRANEKESLEHEVASKRRDFTHKYVRELIGAQRLELHLSQQLAHASTALEDVCFQYSKALSFPRASQFSYTPRLNSYFEQNSETSKLVNVTEYIY